MEKSGFEYERNVVHAGSPHVLFRIEAPGAEVLGTPGDIKINVRVKETGTPLPLYRPR